MIPSAICACVSFNPLSAESLPRARRGSFFFPLAEANNDIVRPPMVMCVLYIYEICIEMGRRVAACAALPTDDGDCSFLPYSGEPILHSLQMRPLQGKVLLSPGRVRSSLGEFIYMAALNIARGWIFLAIIVMVSV